jgi:protein ImuB
VNRLACVNLPEFPLQLLSRRHPEWSGYPVAVLAKDAPQGLVLWVNRKARAAGILPGFRYAGAASLAPALRAVAVSPTEIDDEVARLTQRFMRLTPAVEASGEEPGIFWLGGAGLGLLYPSPKEWARAIHAAAEERGFESMIVVGFTRFGTYAAAKTIDGILIFKDPAEERRAAGEAPLDRLDLDPDFRNALLKLGIRTVGALLSLPAGGIYERFGPKAYRLYRMAEGNLWDPLAPAAPEEKIRQRIILDEPESDDTRLLFVIKRDLDLMLAALAARHQALAALGLRLLIRKSGWWKERIRPAEPTLDAVQILDLVRLRFESLTLSAGVDEVDLEAEESPATHEQLHFFTAGSVLNVEGPPRDLDAANRALARLRAEFGEAAVVRTKLTDGHLPEASFAWEPLDELKLPEPKPDAPKALVRRILAKPVPLPSGPHGALSLGARNPSTSHEWVERLSGPYVVSGGWWHREIHRDYYFAETRRGDILWIYYDRIRRRWFLQGRVE